MESLVGQAPNLTGYRIDPIRVWEIASGKEVAARHGHTEASNGLAFSPDGRMLASVSGGMDNGGDLGLRIWDVASGRPLQHLISGTGGGSRVAYAPDGRSIITAGKDGTALVWDVSDLAARRAPEPPVKR
jgi:WD40 repeat protein